MPSLKTDSRIQSCFIQCLSQIWAGSRLPVDEYVNEPEKKTAAPVAFAKLKNSVEVLEGLAEWGDNDNRAKDFVKKHNHMVMCSIFISRMMYFFLTFPNPSKRQSTTSCTDVYGGIEHPLNNPMGFGGVISVPSLEYDPLVLEVSAMMFCNVDHFTSLREFGLILNMNSKARSNRAAVYLCDEVWREMERERVSERG